MKKIKDFIINTKSVVISINFSLIMLSLYMSKVLYTSPSLQDAFIIVPLIGLYGYTQHIKSKTPDKINLDKELMTRLNNVESHINALRMEKSLKPKSFWGVSGER